MNVRFSIALLLTCGIPALGQKEPKPAPAPRAAGAQHAQAQPVRPQASIPPGIENVRRLARMTLEERQRALANLPPERRQAMIKSLRVFEQMAPAARQRATIEVERLQRLPQQKQNQVRRSLRDFQSLPEDRKVAVGKELDRLNSLPDEERRARMNSEEFRNRYSPAEQQMMSNISEVLPRPEE